LKAAKRSSPNFSNVAAPRRRHDLPQDDEPDLSSTLLLFAATLSPLFCAERGKRDVYCDKQVEKAVTALNCMLKDLWGEVESRGIRKKLKSEYAAYLESKYRRNDGSSI